MLSANPYHSPIGGKLHFLLQLRPQRFIKVKQSPWVKAGASSGGSVQINVYLIPKNSVSHSTTLPSYVYTCAYMHVYVHIYICICVHVRQMNTSCWSWRLTETNFPTLLSWQNYVKVCNTMIWYICISWKDFPIELTHPSPHMLTFPFLFFLWEYLSSTYSIIQLRDTVLPTIVRFYICLSCLLVVPPGSYF